VLAGPDVTARRERVLASYVDIVPTMLAVAGYAAASDLTGRSLVERE
jgi:arylsulfatase A-like enzyme